MKKKIRLQHKTMNKTSVKVRFFNILMSVGIAIVLLMMQSCDDIIEPNISNKEVYLTAPADSLKTQFSTQTFCWDPVKGALSYRLQIVRPSFNRIEQFIMDTTVTDTKFTVNLVPGKYEWGVSAQNGSSATAYFIRTLQIDSSSDLRSQKVKLNYPVNGYITNSKNTLFTWDLLYNATSYYFELRPSNFDGTNAFYTKTTSFDTVNVANIPKGAFVWAVKASNQNTSTDFSTQTIIIDRTAPAKPTLLTPADRSSVSAWPLTLSWKRSETGSKFYDSIYVAMDTLFTNKVVSQVVDTTFLSLTLPLDTTYFWKVKTIDPAGNISEFDVRKFTKTK